MQQNQSQLYQIAEEHQFSDSQSHAQNSFVKKNAAKTKKIIKSQQDDCLN